MDDPKAASVVRDLPYWRDGTIKGRIGVDFPKREFGDSAVKKELKMGTTATGMIEVAAETTAQALLDLLALRGVEYFFANSGTDFASICDAFALRQKLGRKLPRPVLAPHEIPLMSMAHGYYLATGKPQVAMVHVGVGTANCLGSIINASKGRVPILFFAGRTSITEEGQPSSRSAFIHWGQESFDQAAAVREYVKWDYELRNPGQLETVIDRALVMAMSEPRGPIYLTMPPEVLAAAPPSKASFRKQPRHDLPTFYPDPAKIELAADRLARARSPLIITSALGRSHRAALALVTLAEAEGIGVVPISPEYMNFPRNHFCHLGFTPAPHLRESDVILVIDCDVPWFPNIFAPAGSATVIQAGIDPLYATYPIRSFPSDITIQGEPAVILEELARTMANLPARDVSLIDARQRSLRSKHEEMVNKWNTEAEKAAHAKPLDVRWVSHCIGDVLGKDAVVVNEYDNGMRENMGLSPGSYFGVPHSGYLGWGLGTALGFKLAKPDSTVVAAVGDGSYIFAVPSACHMLSASLNLPILVIIFNNQGYAAVKQATLGTHPDGWAKRTNNFPLSQLPSAPGYGKICEVFGGYGEDVTDPDQVRPALERAMNVVLREKRQAVLNMVCAAP
jgi:acetolactate synthase I/II/III large subunit